MEFRKPKGKEFFIKHILLFESLNKKPWIKTKQ